MKRTILAVTFISAIIVLVSFKAVVSDPLKQGATKSITLKKDAVNFLARDPVLLEDGTTYTGTVTASGAINKSGTNIMYTEAIGMALHCTIVMTFPDGTLSIRMNCNMQTLNGRWKILEGTGAYANTKGEGSLVMPNDVDEVLTGFIQ